MAVSGTWNLKYSWGCSGGYGSTTITFNAGGTFSSPPYTGKWSQTNGNIVWRFDQSPGAVYGGVVNGGAIVGNMTTFSGGGCFYALTQSGATQAEAMETAAAEGLDANGAEPKKK